MRVDKMTMGVGLEGRVPFLDHQFVELAMSIPSRLKIKNGKLKYLLKKAVRGIVPDESDRPSEAGIRRAGQRAVSGTAAALAESELRRFCAETDLLDPAEVGRVMQGADGSKRWYLLNLAMWWRTFIARRGSGGRRCSRTREPAGHHRAARACRCRARAPARLVVALRRVQDVDRRGDRCCAHLGRYREGRLLVHRLETAGRPLPLGLALRALSRGRVVVEDVRGRRRRSRCALLARWTAQVATRAVPRPAAAAVTSQRALDRDRTPSTTDRAAPVGARTWRLAALSPHRPQFRRARRRIGRHTSPASSMTSAHSPAADHVLTTDDMPTVEPDVEVHHVPPLESFWNFRELPTFLMNDAFDRAAERAVHGPARVRLPTLQSEQLCRASGSRDVTACRSSSSTTAPKSGWAATGARPLKHEALSRRIEQLNLSSADLIVVVSRAMARRARRARRRSANPCWSIRTASTRIAIGRTSTEVRFANAYGLRDADRGRFHRHVRAVARRRGPGARVCRPCVNG